MNVIKTERCVRYFTNSRDYENYKDFMENGLKCLDYSERTYKFNNCARMYEVQMIGEPKRFTVHVDQKVLKDPRLQKKYIEAARAAGYDV